MRQSLFIIGCNGIPARYGGFETFAEQISFKLSDDFDITVICSSHNYCSEEQQIVWKGINRIFLKQNANGIQSLIYDFVSLKIASRKADYIIILGIGTGLFLPLVRKLRNKKVFIHIDGLEWRRKKWNIITKAILKLEFHFSLWKASKIIIDNKALVNYIPTHYHHKLIRLFYGGEHLPITIKTSSPVSNEYALMVARAEPENNIDLIIKSFIEFGKLDLIIVSNWDHTRYGKRLLRKYSHYTGIKMIGPIFSIDELQPYRNHCKVYIHGHSAGGTNPSLVEAMYSGRPVIAWDNEFNRATTNNLATYFSTKEDLLRQLREINSDELATEASRLQYHAQMNYRWSEISKELKKALLES